MNNPADETSVKAVLIAGPTASGKSALALDLADRLDGVVVNADSMQVYDALRVLTARPSKEEAARIPHYLYGHVPAGNTYSVGVWSREVDALLRGPELAGKVPIFVGGTGLYFKALLGGLSEMPPIPTTVRDHWRNRLLKEGSASLFDELKHCDPQSAMHLKSSDSHRIVRALEIFEATGQSIRDFQQKAGKPLIDLSSVRKLVFRPDRDVLHQRIRSRFENMMRTGAIEEVEGLLSLGVEPGAPVMKAIGVREITAYLEERRTIEEAVELAITATRQYAKRQSTWFRNQFSGDWETADHIVTI